MNITILLSNEQYFFMLSNLVWRSKVISWWRCMSVILASLHLANLHPCTSPCIRGKNSFSHLYTPMVTIWNQSYAFLYICTCIYFFNLGTCIHFQILVLLFNFLFLSRVLQRIQSLVGTTYSYIFVIRIEELVPGNHSCTGGVHYEKL